MIDPARRDRMPDLRTGKTYAFRLKSTRDDGEQETVRFYFTVNALPDGRPGEVFIRADRQGSFVSGVLDILGIMISLGLQHGVPVDLIVEKMRHTRFPPASFTGNGAIPNCSSPLDLLAQILEREFMVTK